MYDVLDVLYGKHGLPLCEVVSWNQLKRKQDRRQKRSTSVWGSELKCLNVTTFCTTNDSLPLCEVVSWNVNVKMRIPSSICLPLCEVVSWNIRTYFILTPPYSRLPLCEVVSWNRLIVSESLLDGGLPLCEVVSWNVKGKKLIILHTPSTSVWGSELKCFQRDP